MTSMNTAATNAAPATDCASPVDVPKLSRKRLRASSEAHEKPATSSPSPTINKRADHTASENAPAVSDATDAVPEQARQTKASLVEALLTRNGGVSLEAMSEATGWKAHTCRAFLAGLRKKGRQIIRACDRDGKSIYLIAPDRSAPWPSEAKQAEAESN
jgi:Protein of unknown function (DUF3489)